MGESVRLSGSIDTIVSGAQLTLILREPDGTTFERIVSSRSDGTYELAFTPTETGTWRVQSSWDGDYAHLGSSSSSLTFNVITSSGSLTIVIKDEKGNAVSGAAVSSTSQPSGQTSCSSMSDTEGTVTFPDLKPGSYSFKVSCSGYEDQTLTTNIVVGEMVNVVIPLSKKLIQMPSQPTVPSPTPSESRSEAAGKSNIQTGIPGFPIVSILLGLSIAVLIMIIRKSR
ncbi:MAG: carboxypeptidase regulatory-like domain-containing protein [Candidatus Bathyarchaeota archaeon]|nr:carboxypeptidase regulatory-like domain-containing protein [Candidatus Bathyarchaeota archaeon]